MENSRRTTGQKNIITLELFDTYRLLSIEQKQKATRLAFVALKQGELPFAQD